MCTIKLLNDESIKLIDSGLSNEPFHNKLEGYRFQKKNNPEYNIAHDEKKVREVFKKMD